MVAWLLDRSLTRFCVVVCAAGIFAVATALWLAAIFQVQISIKSWSVVVVLQIGFQALAALLGDVAAGRRDGPRDGLLGAFALSLAALVLLSETVVAKVRGEGALEVLAESTLIGKIVCSSGGNTCVIAYSTVSLWTFAVAFAACFGAALLIQARVQSGAASQLGITLLVMMMAASMFSLSFLLLSEWGGMVTPLNEIPAEHAESTQIVSKLRHHAWVYLVAAIIGFGWLMAYMQYLIPRIRTRVIRLDGDWLQRSFTIARHLIQACVQFVLECLFIVSLLCLFVGCALAFFIGVYGAVAVFSGLLLVCWVAVEIAFKGLSNSLAAVLANLLLAGETVAKYWLPLLGVAVVLVLVGTFVLAISIVANSADKWRPRSYFSAALAALSALARAAFRGLHRIVCAPLTGAVMIVMVILLLPLSWVLFVNSSPNSQHPAAEPAEAPLSDGRWRREEVLPPRPATSSQTFTMMRLNCDPWSRLGRPRWAFNSAENFDSMVSSCGLDGPSDPTVLVVFGNASRDDTSLGAFELSLRRASALANSLSSLYPAAEVYLGVLGKHRGESPTTIFENLFASDRAAIVIGSTDVLPPIPLEIADIKVKATSALTERNLLRKYEFCLLGRQSDFEDWSSKLPAAPPTQCDWISSPK